MTIYQVTHKARLHNQEVRNTFYFDTTVGNPSSSEWQDIADEIRADYVAQLQASNVVEYTLYGIDYRIVDSSGFPSFSKSFTSGDASGLSGSDSVPTQVALLVSVKGNTTKPNRARTYLCGFTEAQMTDSLWTAAAASVAEAFIDLQSALNAGGTNPLTRVAAQWNIQHTQVIATNDISGEASVASLVPATQRRRRIGVGI